MTLPSLLALLACAWLAGRLCWRRLQWATVVLALLAVFAIGCGPLPNLLLRCWQAPYAQRPALDWAPSNAIVLLTANANNPPGEAPEPGTIGFARIAETLSLYRACRAAEKRCIVLVSGGDTPSASEPLAQVYGQALLQMGVAEPDLVLESRSRTTWQNAEYARAPLARIQADKVWLVSSALHLRRAAFSFQHFGIYAMPVRADYLRNTWSLLPSAYDFHVTDLALHEYAGMVLYRWYAWCDRGMAPTAGKPATAGPTR